MKNMNDGRELKVNVSEGSVLVVIDVQKAYSDISMGPRNNRDAESVIARMIDSFRKRGLRVVHVRHDSLNPNSLFSRGKGTFDFMDEARPMEGETVITKHVNSAFIGTNLENILRGTGKPDVFYLGFTTDYCVSTTVRMSGNLGFRSFVIEDGCAAFERKLDDGTVFPADLVHKVNIASLKGEFAEIVKSEDIQF